MKAFIVFFTLLSLLACSSKRVKEKPNFNLTGYEAQQEYAKFKLSRASIVGGYFESESPFVTARPKELNPLIEEVSPQTMKLLEASKFKERAFWGIWALWVSTIFLKHPHGNLPSLYWVGLGATTGYLFYLDSEREKIADQYNKDLKSKFAPALSYTFQF